MRLLRTLARMVVSGVCLAGVGSVPVAKAADYQGLVCRGAEETGRLLIGGPGFGPHLVSLFATGTNPLAATQTASEHVQWVNDPLHSYVADGTGALCVWAHPYARDAPLILSLPGLVGLEVSYAGDGLKRDVIWDAVLTGCCDMGWPLLWGFAADDTHSCTNIGLSWFAALVPEVSVFALKQALRDGAFYISNGPRIDAIRVAGTAITVDLPQEADVVWLRSGQYQGATGTQPAWVVDAQPGAGHCLKRDRAVRTSTLVLASQTGWPATLGFVRAAVRVGASGVASTQPWRVRSSGTVENPYPAAGTWVRGQSHNHTDAFLSPGPSALLAYRLAYQAKEELASFSTDYSYWESPHRWLPADGTPQILSVLPRRVEAGGTAEMVVTGINFAPEAAIQLGGTSLDPLPGATATELRARLPDGLPTGCYDLCVTNPDRLRGALARGVTISSRTSDLPWVNYVPADGLPFDRSICVACISGEVWVGSVDGVARFVDGRWTALPAMDTPPGRSAYAICASALGGVWIAGGEGLSYGTPDGQWQSLTVGLTDALAATTCAERWGRMAFDREGALWVTNRWNQGLAVLRAGAWERLTVRDGLPGNGQSAVACDNDGVLWVGFAQGLYRWSGGDWLKVTMPWPLTQCDCFPAICVSRYGDVWVAATRNSYPQEGGVLRFRGADVTVYTPQNSGLPSARIRDILAARDGAIWFASDVGLVHLDPMGSSWQTLTTINSGLGCDVITALAEDDGGSLWCATRDGVSVALGADSPSSGSDPVFHVRENCRIGAYVGEVRATDTGPPGVIGRTSFEITGGNDAGCFAIDRSSGWVTVTAPLDSSVETHYALTVVIVTDTTTGTSRTQRVEIFVVPTPTPAPTIRIVPEEPGTSDELRAEILNQALGVDGDPVTGYTVDWSRLGTSSPPISGNPVPADRTAKGDTWQVLVRAKTNPTGLAELVSPLAAAAQVRIGNTPPIIQSAAIEPTLGFASLTVRTTGWEDADADPQINQYQWFRNGTLVAGATTATLHPRAVGLLAGDSIRCVVTPFDGEDRGPAVETPLFMLPDAAVAWWVFPLELTATATPELCFGLQQGATDTVDASLDISAQTEPPLGQGHACLLDQQGLAYQTDIRAWDETKEWRLMVMAGDQDVTLSWVGRAVPPGQCLTLRRLDPLGQPLGVSVANLSHTGSITVPAGRSSLYAISLGWSTVSFHLKPGWNSLSLPLEPKVGSVAALFADADGRSASDGGSVWTWRDGGYVSVTQVRPFEGYWVFSPAATSCTVVGSPVEDTTYQLRKGWTLVGPAAVLAAPALPTLQGLWWTWEGRTYVPAQTLLPTRAYWVYVSAEATTVELGE